MGYKTVLSVRDYNFSDSKLEALASLITANITRDLAALAARGITPATIAHLKDLREALKNTPTDVEARSLVGEAVEIKEAARRAAFLKARTLRTAARNVFGRGTSTYDRFGFDNMSELKDIELIPALYGMKRLSEQLQAALASEGIDASFLAAFLSTIETFENEVQNVSKAEEERDALTEDRANKGNILFKEVVRLCSIGKDVFAPVSPALYNDYVIEDIIGTGKKKMHLQK